MQAILWLLALSALAGDTPAETAYQQGLAFVDDGKLKSAVMSFREAMVSAEDEADAVWADRGLLAIARIYAGLGRIEQAREYYDQLHHDALVGEQAVLEAAWMSLALGETEDAARRLKRLRRRSPEAAVLYAATQTGHPRSRALDRALALIEGASHDATHAEHLDAWREVARRLEGGAPLDTLPAPFPDPGSLDGRQPRVETATPIPGFEPDEPRIFGTIDDL